MIQFDPFSKPLCNKPIDHFPVRSDDGGSSDEEHYTENAINPHSILNGLMYTGILSAIVGISFIAVQATNYYFPESNKLIQQNVIGNPQPETYIIKNGVRYYSHIDGKDISDLLKK